MAKAAHYRNQGWLNNLKDNESLEASEPIGCWNNCWGVVILTAKKLTCTPTNHQIPPANSIKKASGIIRLFVFHSCLGNYEQHRFDVGEPALAATTSAWCSYSLAVVVLLFRVAGFS